MCNIGWELNCLKRERYCIDKRDRKVDEIIVLNDLWVINLNTMYYKTTVKGHESDLYSSR